MVSDFEMPGLSTGAQPLKTRISAGNSNLFGCHFKFSGLTRGQYCNPQVVEATSQVVSA